MAVEDFLVPLYLKLAFQLESWGLGLHIGVVGVRKGKWIVDTEGKHISFRRSLEQKIFI